MDCGKPVEYTLERPKFCQSCGAQFDKKISSATSSVKSVEPTEEIEASEEEERIPNIDKLEVDTVFYNVKPISIKDLAQFSAGAEPGERIVSQVGEVNEKDFLEQFQREAGTMRKKNDRGS